MHHPPHTCTNHTVEGRHWRHSWPNPSEKQKHENGKPPNRKVQRQKREAPIFFYAEKLPGHGPCTCTNHTVEGRHWRHCWPNPSEKQKHENGKPPNRKVQRQKRKAPIFFYAEK